MKHRMFAIAFLLCAWQAASQGVDKPSPFPKPRQAHPKTSFASDSQAPAAAAEDIEISPDKGEASFFSGDELVAAHASYPLGSRVKVTNVANGKSVEVRIVGRFSNSSRRIINVSESAARQLDFIKAGTAEVRIEPAR